MWVGQTLKLDLVCKTRIVDSLSERAVLGACGDTCDNACDDASGSL